MVDTSRGYADLKALFQNNVNRSIHPQSMRDLVESIEHPTSDFHIGGPLGERFANAGFFTPEHAVTLPASPSAAYGESVLIPLPKFADPNGWFGPNDFTLASDDPNSAWGVEIGPDQAVMLPPGLYQGNVFAYYGSTPVAPFSPPRAFVYTEFDQMTYDTDYNYALPRDTSPGFLWRGYYGPLILSEVTSPHPLTSQFVTTSEVFMLMNDTDEPKPYALVGGCINHTSDIVISSVSFNIIKVA